MTNAYPEIYLSRAQTVMGEMLDYAVNDCGMDGDEFLKMFVCSSACRRMENGEPAYLVGKSGVEIAIECVEEISGRKVNVEPKSAFSRTVEFWCGWISGYYQWATCRKYLQIFDAIPLKEMRRLYYPLHEADAEKAADAFDKIVRAKYPDTNLKRIRTASGRSQQALAEASGVALRAIRAYEQRTKDINKAQAETIFMLSRTLGCEMEDLLER